MSRIQGVLNSESMLCCPVLDEFLPDGANLARRSLLDPVERTTPPQLALIRHASQIAVGSSFHTSRA